MSSYYDLGFSKFLTKTIVANPQTLNTSSTVGSIRSDDIYGGSIINSKLGYDYRTYKAVVSPIQGQGDYNDIQLAINYVNSKGGGNILLKSGIYTITKDIIFYSNINIIGEDVVSTFIDFNNTDKKFLCQGTVSSYLTNINFSNLTIENSRAWDNGGFIFFSYINNFSVTDCKFVDNFDPGEGVNSAVYTDNSSIGKIERCNATNSSLISISSNSSNVFVSNNSCSGSTNSAISIFQSEDVVVLSNYITNSTYYAIYNDSDYSIIAFNEIKDCPQGIVNYNANTKCIILSNKIHSTTSLTNGIFLQQMTNSVVSDNIIVGIFTTGIKLINSDRNIVTNNQIDACTTGINIDSDSDRNIVSNNYLYGSGTPLTDAGSNTLKDGSNLVS